MPTTQPKPGSGPEANSIKQASRRTPLWQALLLPVLAILIFFALLEGGLALFGVQPGLQNEDPFVGFESTAPLFVSSRDANGEQLLATAANKKDFFNRQSFALPKPPDTYRIFTLGGSTTYGRPYDDSTSFSGWLRELLPAADRSKQWEVINAGGISYASYRVAKLMEELIRYQPDLFIIYTGHNEFLEERTYRKLRELSPMVRSTAALLARTRTWSAMCSALQHLDNSPETGDEDRYKLSSEVDAILDRSVGLDGYQRDDGLQQNVIRHFRISLENMVTLARSVGARVIFVKPASNLKDSSPFKSQDTAGISEADLQSARKMLSMSKPLVWQQQWEMAVHFLDQAIALNPESADLHYRRGQALFALGRYDEAKHEFITARDEDVCPLRALTPIGEIVAGVAREQQVMLVDYQTLLEKRMLSTKKHSILGEEFFLDHVHPTIEGHKLLAVALLEAMSYQGLVHPAPDWRDGALATVSATIEGRVNPAKQGQALANLARVLLWAGKNDDAARLARQALDIAGDYREVGDNAATSLATAYIRNGQPKTAIKLLYKYLEKAPDSIELRLKLGQLQLDHRDREEAAANFLLVSHQMPYYDWGHALFGIDMAERGRPRIAYSSLMEALRLNPNNSDARRKLDQIRPALAGQRLDPRPLTVQMTRYPSSAPRKLVQGRLNSSGNFIPDGIEVEFHENGRLKRYIDIEQGKVKGLEMIWDAAGKQLSRQVHQ
ncbi:MAG: tetratricopeptide repeat protein [Desulfuromonadales bacterium]|nr:tetratricopeptide repeat protein [Desulfuromonadales bacterium]